MNNDTQTNEESFVRRHNLERRVEEQTPPYLADDGLVLFDRREQNRRSDYTITKLA